MKKAFSVDLAGFVNHYSSLGATLISAPRVVPGPARRWSRLHLREWIVVERAGRRSRSYLDAGAAVQSRGVIPGCKIALTIMETPRNFL